VLRNWVLANEEHCLRYRSLVRIQEKSLGLFSRVATISGFVFWGHGDEAFSDWGRALAEGHAPFIEFDACRRIAREHLGQGVSEFPFKVEQCVRVPTKSPTIRK
jgi:hypothetical protein